MKEVPTGTDNVGLRIGSKLRMNNQRVDRGGQRTMDEEEG